MVSSTATSPYSLIMVGAMAKSRDTRVRPPPPRTRTPSKNSMNDGSGAKPVHAPYWGDTTLSPAAFQKG
ncbi:exported hypothetical protein [Cupriavidus taiwanensis]|nr:exported hypothetical protein [Cupriavidus taiwanensis]SOZ47903.1 exported hypothetical protein [Cupriavidus taiwanensis]